MITLYRDFKTREEIDAQYDVERSVPDFMLYAREWAAESARARRQLMHHADVRYGPTRAEYLNIFPAARPNAPVLLYMHGGYWRMLSARDNDLVALGLAPNGVTVVSVNYALCPAVTLDEIARQVRAAVAWTYANIRDYHGNPERIYVSGHSAGGQLSLMAMLTDWAGEYGLPRDVVKGGFSISGVMDLSPLRYSFLQPALRLDPELIERNSPQFQVRRMRTPLLMAVGGEETEEFRRQSRDFAATWREAGNSVEEIPLPGRNHFTAILPLADPRSEMVTHLCRFMRHTPSGFPQSHLPVRRDFGRLPDSGLGGRR